MIEGAVAVVPWYPGEDASQLRFRPLNLVSACLLDAGLVLRLAPDSGRPFTRARAINRAVESMALIPPEILVVNDADSLVAPEQLWEAIKWAKGAPGLVWAYTRYKRLERDASFESDLWGDLLYSGPGWQLDNAPSLGCMAIRYECFQEVEGFDEAFEGWGYEDMAFAVVCGERWPHRRVPGDLIHLWHGDRREDGSPADADPADVERNWRHFEKEYAA